MPPKMKPMTIRFRFALASSANGLSVGAGDKIERADGGWLVTQAENGQRSWVPDVNVLEVLL
jgi:hypothetical protein